LASLSSLGRANHQIRKENDPVLHISKQKDEYGKGRIRFHTVGPETVPGNAVLPPETTLGQ
jgi:hypothetical protein